jgi:SHS2 domain-containing protein
VTREGWEYFDVAADVGVRAWGPDLPACFRQCGLGVLNLMVPLGSVRPEESREVAAWGESNEALLVNWVNELIYLHDVEGFVVHDLQVADLGSGRVRSVLVGEAFEPSRHPRGILVKAATYHDLGLDEAPGETQARLVLDV